PGTERSKSAKNLSGWRSTTETHRGSLQYSYRQRSTASHHNNFIHSLKFVFAHSRCCHHFAPNSRGSWAAATLKLNRGISCRKMATAGVCGNQRSPATHFFRQPSPGNGWLPAPPRSLTSRESDTP